jgi:hypothetical protein
VEAGFNLLLEHSVCGREERTRASTMAGLFRRLFGHAGRSHRKNEGAKKAAENVAEKVPKTTVKVPIPQERKVDPPVIRQIRHYPPPVVSKCTYGNGGVQGLKWYSERLRVDDDGDIAEEFLSEVVPADPGNRNRRARFECVRQKTRPVTLKGPVCTHNGNVHQIIETLGKSSWV